MPARSRVFLVDDHPLVREWLASIISVQPDLEICGQAEEAFAALASVPLSRPDVVVVDLKLLRGSGLELITDLRTQFPAARLLVLTTHDEVSVAERAFRAGAHGYAMKSEAGQQILDAIRSVLAGKLYISPALAADLPGRMSRGTPRSGPDPFALLSRRETEVFRLRGEGRDAKEIAGLLRINVKTVASYESRIKEKLGLKSSGELMREAVLWHERARNS